MIIIFQTAYYDDEGNIIEDRGKIACAYLKSWFLTDLLAVIPFQLLIGTGGANADLNGLARFVRVGRLYKLLKLARVFKAINILSERQVPKSVQDVFKKSLGIERLTMFLCGFVMVCHIFACLWIFMARL